MNRYRVFASAIARAEEEESSSSCSGNGGNSGGQSYMGYTGSENDEIRINIAGTY